MGHVKSDYNQGKSKVIIDGTEAQEERADKFAFNAMIPEKIFNEIVKTKGNELSLQEISARERIPMCYIVSSLAKEGTILHREKIYNKYVLRIDKGIDSK